MKTIYFFLGLSLLTSCSVLPNSELNEERTQNTIERLGRSSAILLLKNQEHPELAATLLGNNIRCNVLSWFTPNTQINSEIFEGIMDRFKIVNKYYSIILSDILDELFRYIAIPTGDNLLSNRDKLRLNSFFCGVIDGCTIFTQ